jgi:hypothetical protein
LNGELHEIFIGAKYDGQGGEPATRTTRNTIIMLGGENGHRFKLEPQDAVSQKSNIET